MKRAVLTVDWDQLWEDDLLCCPVCGDPHTHINSVSVHTASGSGATLRAGGEDSSAYWSLAPGADEPAWHNHRRHAFTLHGFCENGHAWDIQVLQHKGSTAVRVLVPETDPDYDDLWRR